MDDSKKLEGLIAGENACPVGGWVYRMGLKLDGIIPLRGMDNLQRIEVALDNYTRSKAKDQNTKEGAQSTPLCYQCGNCKFKKRCSNKVWCADFEPK